MLNIARTSNLLSDSMEQLLKPSGITGTQYNVLRILRGAEPSALCRNEVRDRMLNRMTDATRLFDRMEAAGLLTRSRDDGDRRLVTARISRKGRKLVDELDEVVESEHRRRLGHLADRNLRTLVKLLTEVRYPRGCF